MVEALLAATILSVTQVDPFDAEAEAEAAVAVPAVEETDEQRDEGLGVSLLDYQVPPVQRLDVADGRTRVSVENNAPAVRSGSMPVRFFIDNTQGPTQVIRFSIRGSVSGSAHVVTREAEVRAGERTTVTVPVPHELRYGSVTAAGPGITQSSGAQMYFQSTYEPQRVVLTLSQPEAFEKFIGRAPRYSGANVLVHAVPPAEAPRELASYLGYDLVVVPDPATLDALDGAARLALEAFVVSGGHALIGGQVRSTSTFPSVKDGPYGFGRVFLSDGAPSVRPYFREGLPVNPQGPVPEYERRYNSSTVKASLLPQATAPLGRFLLIITLFTLAIGPGSIWVARRRGPAALLVTIPGTAFVTCLAIVGYSLVADGFTVHAASYSFTLLDNKQHRLVTTGLTAYYANLAPSKARFAPGTMLVAPWEERRERYIASLDWRDGLTVGGDFVPSRTYREWGFVSVEPSRARLVVKQKGDAWIVQNALGERLHSVVVNVDGTFFTARDVREGGEAALEPGNNMSALSSTGMSRFDRRVTEVMTAPIGAGEFLARIEGQGLLPTGGISAEQAGGENWVRGGFER